MPYSAWDYRFLGLAKHIAQWSKDPSTKTGAVLTRDHRVISVGFNGLPVGVDDSDERLNNRELKLAIIVHCERNAIIFAQQDLSGCTLYTWPFMSCSVCAAMVIQAGITRHIYPAYAGGRWAESFKLSEDILTEAGVELTEIHNAYLEGL